VRDDAAASSFLRMSYIYREKKITYQILESSKRKIYKRRSRRFGAAVDGRKNIFILRGIGA
jgi:hypothetical protein